MWPPDSYREPLPHTAAGLFAGALRPFTLRSVAEGDRPRIGQSALVGREDECALLAQTLDESAHGLGAFVLIEGPAGIGKSRLAREAATMAGARGFLTLVGVCSHNERGTPYGPIIDAMRDLRRESDSAQLQARRLYEALAGSQAGAEDNASTSAQQNRSRVTDGMLELLKRAPGGAGCIVIVEDVHWADYATMRLLNDISRHAHDLPITFVLTYRDEEIDSNDALGDSLHALNSSRLNVRTISLRALTWSETRKMAQTVLGMAWMPPTAFVDHLYARAEGNPFFTEEILRALPPDGAASRLDLRIPEQLPVTVSRLLEQRIKRLPGRGVQVMATAAVLGRRFDQLTLLKVVDLSQRVMLKALHDAIDAHLIRDSGDGRTLEFQHALVHEAAENTLLSSERKELHRRIAQELEAQVTPRAESSAIAYHYGQAGMPERLGHHAVAAADDAWRAGAPVEAARWFEQALGAAADRREDPPETVLRRAADAFAAARLPKLAGDAFERLIERQRARGDVLAEGETLAEFATLFPADFTRWTAMLQHALRILEPLGETAALARVYARLASLYVLTSSAREAIEAGRKARDIAKNTGATDAEAVGRRALGIIVAAGGDFAAGRRFLERSIELAKSANKHTDVYLSSLGLVDSAIRANDWEVAETTVRESIDYARKLGSGLEAGSLTARFADLLRFTGRLEESRLTIDKALLLLDEDEVYLWIGALQVKADVLADLGRWQEVREVIEPMLSAAERSAQFHIHGGALFLLARAAHGEGRKPEARDLLERTLAEWRSTQDNYYCLPMLLFACRLACEAGDLEAARRFIVELHGVFARTPLCSATIPAAEAWLAVAEGRKDDAAPLWATSAEAFAELGRVVDAARSRLELGRTLLAQSRQDARDHARRELLAVQASAAGLPEAVQAEALLRRHRLVVKRAAARAGPLTEREREIVALIARGMTNRRIAAELTLSTRTVDNHVSRILDKLQLASRSQIVAFAIEHGVTTA